MNVYRLYKNDSGNIIEVFITNDDVMPNEETIKRCQERGYVLVPTGYIYAPNAGLLDNAVKDEIDAYEEDN